VVRSPSQEDLDAIRDAIVHYTVPVFDRRGGPTFGGTAVLIASRKTNASYLLTAGHVWDALKGEQFALALEDDRMLFDIKRAYVQPRVFFEKASKGQGPDVALLKIPDLDARQIRVTKNFYDLDRIRKHRAAPQATRDKLGTWVLVGVPEELSTFSIGEASLEQFLLSSSIRSRSMRDGFDYVEMSYDSRDRGVPKWFGGISGAGLWYVPVPEEGFPAGRVDTDLIHLEGVAFYQEPTDEHEGVIGCHGRRSIFEKLLPNL
jgi:hypothetical protein